MTEKSTTKSESKMNITELYVFFENGLSEKIRLKSVKLSSKKIKSLAMDFFVALANFKINDLITDGYNNLRESHIDNRENLSESESMLIFIKNITLQMKRCNEKLTRDYFINVSDFSDEIEEIERKLKLKKMVIPPVNQAAYNFKSTRLSLGLTQKQAAKLLDIHPRTVTGWENGCPGRGKSDRAINNATDLMIFRAKNIKQLNRNPLLLQSIPSSLLA